MLLKELLALNESKILEAKAPQKITTKVSTFGDGVYLIQSSVPTVKFDKTEHIGGAYVSAAIKEYNDAIDSGDEDEIENAWFNGAPNNVKKFLNTHQKVVEISAYDGSSGELSETLLLAAATNQVKTIISNMQDPSHYEEDDFESFAAQIAKKTKTDEKVILKWVKKWKQPNKIYTLSVGDNTLVMIAEND